MALCAEDCGLDVTEFFRGMGGGGEGGGTGQLKPAPQEPLSLAELVVDYEFAQVITTDYGGITAPLQQHYFVLLTAT